MYIIPINKITNAHVASKIFCSKAEFGSDDNFRRISKHSSDSDIFVKNKEINFRGSNKEGSIGDELSYEKFMSKYHEVYGDRPMNEVIGDVIHNRPEMNHGKDKRVFVFPKMEEYLIAHLYNIPEHNNDLPIEKCDIRYPKYNFGQPIAKNGSDILIMKCIQGIPNSVSGVHDVESFINANGFVTEAMAKEYLSKLKLFEHFPQESYDDLANQFKYLIDRGQFIDFANSNNILTDVKQKKFHMIDLLTEGNNADAKKVSDRIGGKKNGVYEMICLLLDARLQGYYLDKMTQEEKNETINLSKNVIRKSFIATKKASLSLSNDLICEIMKMVQTRTHCDVNLLYRYSEFLKLYKI